METLEDNLARQILRAQQEMLTVHQALGNQAVYGMGSKLIEFDMAVMSELQIREIQTKATRSLTRLLVSESPIDLINDKSTLDYRKYHDVA